MKEPDKTGTYSDKNKTTVYRNEKKNEKITEYPVKIGENIALNEKEYLIEEIISSSTGEAIIYKVRDSENKIFALKLYFEFKDPELEPNHEALSRIKNIHDKDILALIDFGTGINKYKGKYCYEISEFAEGHDLFNVSNFKKKYTYEFVLNEVVPQIYKGILKLHENRIYHCDLKPGNVFYLDKNQEEIVIGDYGSAKTFDFEATKQSRKTTTIKGTDFYLPPEQAKGFISEKNDYYSFGMILLHLMYPEAVQTSENEPDNISHSKLKLIIEKQFERKSIVEYRPKFEKINRLIEGLTQINFNSRWGKEEVEKWLRDEKIQPAGTKAITVPSKALKFGNFIINTPDDLRNYILNSPKWYYDLVEDRDNWNDFLNWVRGLKDATRRSRPILNSIVKNYSQEGIEFVGEAFIWFFFPGEPVVVGTKVFDLSKPDHLKRNISEIFVYLLNEIWDSATEKELKLYILRIEFALGFLANSTQEVKKLFKSLYRILGINSRHQPYHLYYTYYAFSYLSKKSKNKLRKFLFEFLPIDYSIQFDQVSNNNNLHYTLELSVNNYLKDANIKGTIETNKSARKIPITFPKKYNSFENFCEITVDKVLQSIYSKYKLTSEEINEYSVVKFKTDFLSDYRSLINEVEDAAKKLEKTLSKEQIHTPKFVQYQHLIKTIIDNKQYHRIKEVPPLIDKINGIVKRKLKEYEEKKKDQNFNRFIRVVVTLAVAVPIISIILAVIFDKKSTIKINKENTLKDIEMVEIEGGTFIMGSNSGEKDESPPHLVLVDNFSLSKYEITNQQFTDFLNDFGDDEIWSSSHEYNVDMIRYKYDPDIIKTDTGWMVKKGFENFPVIEVTWFGANEFCKWAEGRLPTEAEWEYAVKGGNKTERFQYPGSDSIREIAWYEDNSNLRVHPVGEKKPNELGLYDMGGNANEWCLDWYAENYYKNSPKDNPVNLKEGEYRVRRGGSYYSASSEILPSNRNGVAPDIYRGKTGFRLCKGRDIEE